MKLVSEFYEIAEAENVSSRMRQAGVMTIVTSKKSHNLNRVKTGAFKVGLWAVIDEQFHDAKQLLQDHNHKPKKILSASEMEEIHEKVKMQTSMGFKRLFETTTAWVLGGVLLAIFVYVAIGIINDA